MKERKPYILSTILRDWRIWTVLIGIIVLIVTAVIVVRFGLQPDGPIESMQPMQPADPSYQISQDYVGNVSITGINRIDCSIGSTNITTKLENPAGNAGRYYLVFEIRLPDDSAKGYEVLYSSDPVEPGQLIRNITFERALLERGTYEAILHVQPLRMDEDRTPTNNVDFEIEIVVK